MAQKSEKHGKLNVLDRVAVAPEVAARVACGLFRAAGAAPEVAREVADHLVEADQCGVESHGIVRTLQYTREMLDGTLDPKARPEILRQDGGRLTVQAHGAIGIPAMRIAHEAAAEAALENGISAVGVLGAGHTGRLGAFGEIAARRGCLSIALGGGNRKRWRMVAPYGGREALLPTNPFCIAMPGGDRGPVVIDIATSQAAGGWIYAARAAGVDLPEGLIVDRTGAPSRDPEDYFNGGAILPKGGPLGYGLALIAELVGEAMLGPVLKGEINWLVLALDCRRYHEAPAMQVVAEEILAEIRVSAPAEGRGPVQVPGERERDLHATAQGKPLMVPGRIWAAIEEMAREMGAEPG
ncbi:Ldh family oxidoreductase [Nioella ostreopsis]|uniref:Ldh family oxidoreductase n=1 Tax=Nioella ostreopsis TaxID=2448479 RepID=UPI000FDB51B1|nr:Ldh family oxidoreductase [Nioella ostreopsis]